MDHDFSGPTIYDPADFTPMKKCKNCGASRTVDDLDQLLAQGSSVGTCSGRAASGGYLDPKYAKKAATPATSSTDPYFGALGNLQKQVTNDLKDKLYEIARRLGVDPVDLGGLTKAVVPDRCECGAHKVSGVGRGQVGHSSWCPWSQP